VGGEASRSEDQEVAAMAETTTKLANKIAWVDLASKDAEGSRTFYANLFGWDVQVNPDPQYGGYALAKLGGGDVAGIGPAMDPNAPPAWNVYIGADDLDDLAQRITTAGGTVVMAPFPVGEQGAMAVFQDPTGAFISAWKATQMRGFQSTGEGTFAWAELNSRGIDQAKTFYAKVFGWTHETMAGAGAMPDYTTFFASGEPVAGAMPMDAAMPPEIPSYWMPYFGVADVDASFDQARALGAREMVSPTDFPGGRFAILGDLDGAMFGLMRMGD
jgi:predicted enzyme related to lactoylglutathione lyase